MQLGVARPSATAPGTIRARALRWGRRRRRPPTAGPHHKETVMFEVLELSLTVLDRIASVEAKVRTRRKSLADQITRSAESIGLNVAEGRLRAGLDRIDLYRRASGSAGELTFALRFAKSRGFITPYEFAHVDEPLDSVRAILWTLTH